MNKFKILLALLLLNPGFSLLQAQTADTLTAAFWNLENLFDTIDDPVKADEEFLPGSEKEWTEERLEKKMYNLSRVIRSMNNGSGPDLLGVCEVENRAVLDSMINKFLPDMNYEIVHSESPDNRGIDNAFIFRSNLFKLLDVITDTVRLPDLYPTRLILGIKLLTGTDDTIFVFVNHWPSRRGGEAESEPNRIEAAKTLRARIDSIKSETPDPNILIVGDFNDEPLNKSLLNILGAQPFICDSAVSESVEDTLTDLFNLSYKTFSGGEGTYRYKDDWNMLDQIIVSKQLITGNDLVYICDSFTVFKPYFLQTHSGYYEGTAFPTYGGKKYLGGYSDHYPVLAKILLTGD
ncbi:MAG: endonuclease [Ignavibacteriaceae bacterium]